MPGMENLLLEFINTLDLSLKKFQAEVGDSSGISKLTISQFQYINAIYELGEPAITEIAKRLNITKASVTTGIHKLINMGYVIKTQSNTDKRVFHVSLTEASEQLIKAKYRALKEYGEFISAALSEEETRQFEETLTKLVKLFKQA
jgi:DNA-binding MarR family transcriptional regulator